MEVKKEIARVAADSDKKFALITNVLKSIQESMAEQTDKRNRRSEPEKPVTTTGSKTSAPGGNKRNEALKGRSYAAVLASKKEKAECFRHIMITDENIDKTRKQIINDDAFKEIEILQIQSKGTDCITLKCSNEEEANKLEASLKTKYKTGINVVSVKKAEPSVKVVRLPTGLSDDDLETIIREQNKWAEDAAFHVKRQYVITVRGRSYTNAILACDLKSHAKFINHGKVIIHLGEYNVFEFIDLLQCNKCLRYGHTKRTCENGPRCKMCGGKHFTEDCKEEDPKPFCPNCDRINAKNKEGPHHKTNHTAVSDRCPARLDRIEGLKEFHARKSKN